MFTLEKQSPLGRLGTLATAHGSVPTPFFLPVATAGAMKGITLEELALLGADILLCNTYHLHIHPGESVVQEADGLHRFIGWDKPILTDSGGFQVFSLSSLRSITDDGVRFHNHRNGDELFLGPLESIRIQHALGADIIMCFDECPPSTAARAVQLGAVDRTLKWAKACKEEHERLGMQKISSLFGIVQGGLERDLRQKCAEELIAIGFDGYAIGGLAVGESEQEMLNIVQFVCPLLPVDKPRYLMGVGELHQQRAAVAAGVDMFDCVAAMREARHGNVWLGNGQKLKITRAAFLHDHSVIDSASPSELSRRHLKSYLHHLMKLGERYGETIACMQNVGVTLQALRNMRTMIETDHIDQGSIVINFSSRAQ